MTNPVLLVDGVGRAKVHELGDVRYLPSVIEYPLDEQRVDVDDDGHRTLISVIPFRRTDAKDDGMPIYRMAGVSGYPAIRRGYQ